VHDVVIVGAGPAGAAAALAARAARPDGSVVLLDRSGFPRDKACGDAVSAHAVAVLDALGAASAVAGVPPARWFELATGDGPAVRADLPAGTYTVPRAVFDHRLVTCAVAAGATLRRHHLRRIDVRRDGVVVDGEVAGRVLIAADGANSRVRRLLGARRNPDGALAVAMRGYASVDGEAGQRIVLDEVRWPAYGWAFVVGDGTANVGWGTLRAGGGATARQLRAMTRAMASDRPVGRLRAHHLPLTTHRPRPAIGPVLLTGDAASLINPLSGEGIFYALLSGALAGRAAVTAADPGRAYSHALRRRLGRHLRHTRLASRLLDVPRLRRSGVHAAGADPAVFRALTDLALGDGLITPRMLLALAHPR
jgi:geranylgeranyl reductase family protein